MSDALEPFAGYCTYSTVLGYKLFSWSLSTVWVVRRASSVPVSAGVSMDSQTDGSFPSAPSSHNQTSSDPPAFGCVSVRAWAHKPCLLGGLLRLAPALSNEDEKGRHFCLITRLGELMILCRPQCEYIQVTYCRPRAPLVWQAKDCSINTSFWKLFLYWQMSE